MYIIEAINESKTEKGKGSKSGRTKGKKSKGKSHTTSEKSRVKIYPGIVPALKKGYPGQMFSTKNADRLYVITDKGWGKDNDQRVGGRTAKGFASGTSFGTVKKYANRTMVKHGTRGDKPLKTKKNYKGGYRGKRGK